MTIACLSFSEKAYLLGETLSKLTSSDYSFIHISNATTSGGIKAFLKEKWSFYDGFVFISATAIAVRMIHPYIEDKTKDPAILVIDDQARFVISLLSGHIGGANKLTKYISNTIGARPIITTASDGMGIEAVDLFAIKNNYYIEDIDSVSKITALMVNNKKVALLSEDEKIIKYKNIRLIKDLSDIDKQTEGIIIVSSKEKTPKSQIQTTILRPKVINVGLGSKKGVPKAIVIKAIEKALLNKGLSKNSICTFATVDIKAKEVGIIEAAKHFNSPLKIFTREEIKKVDDKFKGSKFVKNTLGVSCVSAPCAYLLGGEVILEKFIYKGVTISLSRIE